MKVAARSRICTSCRERPPRPSPRRLAVPPSAEPRRPKHRRRQTTRRMRDIGQRGGRAAGKAGPLTAAHVADGVAARRHIQMSNSLQVLRSAPIDAVGHRRLESRVEKTIGAHAASLRYRRGLANVTDGRSRFARGRSDGRCRRHSSRSMSGAPGDKPGNRKAVVFAYQPVRQGS